MISDVRGTSLSVVARASELIIGGTWLRMCVSGFHQHFTAVSALSPLQFQERLRLQEARRLLLGEDLAAASAGYRDASHFNREYKRLFGAPPLRDVERLREAATHSAGL